MMWQIVGVCWDLDGTVALSEKYHLQKKFNVAAAHGIDLTEKDLPHLEAISARRVWNWLKEERGLTVDLPQFLKECSQYIHEHMHEVKLRPGMREAFDHFDRLGLWQGIVSSSERNDVDATLSQVGILNHMAFTVTAEDVKKTKPDPEPYLTGVARICEKLGLDPSTTDRSRFISVEDSVTGVISAKRAGLTTILWPLKPGVACQEADYIVYTPADLLKACKEITSMNRQMLPAMKVPVRKHAGMGA